MLNSDPGGAPASHVYCTYFDSAYLARGAVMLRSLRRHDPASEIVVLALDELCARVLRAEFAAGVRVIETATLHAFAPALRRIREQRSPWAYYATQKPALGLFTMESAARPEPVMCIDADTWFFSRPAPMFEEIGGASIGLSPNRFHAATQHLEVYGSYGAGCVYWRDDALGRRCLAEWLDDCLEWCAEQPQPDGRFMNQGYLNRWPARYAGVHVIQHPGSNLAPWNVDGHLLSRDGARVLVDGRPLIFYHFSGVLRDAEGAWYSFHPHLQRQFDLACEAIYRPYLSALEAESAYMRQTYGLEGLGTVRPVTDWAAAVRFTR